MVVPVRMMDRWPVPWAALRTPGSVVLGWAALPVLLPLTTAPLAFGLLSRVRREQGAALNLVLASTAKLVFLHGLLFALGLAVGT